MKTTLAGWYIVLVVVLPEIDSLKTIDHAWQTVIAAIILSSPSRFNEHVGYFDIKSANARLFWAEQACGVFLLPSLITPGIYIAFTFDMILYIYFFLARLSMKNTSFVAENGPMLCEKFLMV